MKFFKKLTTKQWIGFIVLIIIVVLVTSRLRDTQGDAYSSFTVEKTTVSDELLLAGTIDAKNRVDLGFATSGRVKRVNFEVGDTVKEGQIIAEIEQNRLSADFLQAQANLNLTQIETSVDLDTAQDSLERQLEEQNSIVDGLYQQYLTGDLQAYNTEVDEGNIPAPTISGSYLSTIEGDYVLDVYASNAISGYSYKLSGLESGLFTAEAFQPGRLGSWGLDIQFIPGVNYSDTQWVVSIPNQRSSTYVSRRTAYENALATRDRIISDAENNLDRVSGVVIDTQISRNEALQDQARAQVNAVAAQLGDGKIRAPFDGVIARNDLEIGEIVNAFTTEIILFGGEEKELNLNVPEIYINKIALGDSVDVTLDAYEDIKFTGSVEFIDFIDTEVDGVPVYQTDIVINTLDSRIRSGMNAKASIISEEEIDVLAIPAHYIQRNDNGEEFVLVKNPENNNSFTEQVIETGLRGNEGLVHVISGLTEGQTILSENK